MALARIRTKKK